MFVDFLDPKPFPFNEKWRGSPTHTRSSFFLVRAAEYLQIGDELFRSECSCSCRDQFMYDDDDDTDSQLSIRPDQMAFRRHRPRGRTQYCAQQYTDRNTHSSTVRDRPGIKSKLAAATGPCATDRPGSGSNAAGMCRRVARAAHRRVRARLPSLRRQAGRAGPGRRRL